MTQSPYQIIKRSIADGIAAGQWRPGDTLPSEMALTRMFQLSRMTVNRAMRELANENVIRPVPGLGSFVAEPAARSALVEIRNIADEIAARGNRHSARVLSLGVVAAGAVAARDFGVAALFRSEILHLEDGVPLRLEDRLANPAAAPGYLEQDFTQTTPNAFLTRVAPLQKAAHQVQAVSATEAQAALLQLGPLEPCLLVVRHSWPGGGLASLAHLYHLGTRFALSGKFSAGEFSAGEFSAAPGAGS